MKIFILALFALLGPIRSGGCYEETAEENCRRDCPTYDAQYVGVVQVESRSYECWCRQGTEPLRIW